MEDTNSRFINCTLIDALSLEPRDVHVSVENGEIADVSDSAIPDNSDTKTIDLRNKYILPGLWDVHTHIGRGIPDHEARDETTAQRTVRAGDNCQRALTLGITSLRAVGEKDFIDVAWKQAFESGEYVGPNLYTCGWFITTTAGHFLKSGCAIEVDGPTEYIRTIREQIKNGVDFIKLNLTGGVMGPKWDKMPNTFPLQDELKAAFDVCEQRGYKVVAHAGGVDGIKKAISLGAHTLEHGYQFDDEAINMLAESETYYVPTLSLTHMNRGEAFADSASQLRWMKAHPIDEGYRERAIEAAVMHASGFKKAIAAGVKIACGSDLDLPYGALFETEMLVKCGMTEHQAITAATLTSAQVCLADEKNGTIEPGKKADFIILNNNPLENISNLQDVYMVVKDGRIVRDDSNR
ncbi:MAG TPA: amidohydrolase family protein [Rhodospirillales bacterium]|jgi:imidazolonepropionase-like amidohydrolase|nr:amidohydrolase family protein [Dehalococcoidia bacterium]HIO39410.1 amidohydrolase family protein [Rhodospirillales bacterium]